MLNINYLQIKDNSFHLAKYKVTTRRFRELTKETYDLFVDYFTEEDYEDYKTNYVAKHQLMDIIETEEIDTTGYEWVLEITPEDNSFETISKVASCNSKEEYEASLEQNKDLYLLDIEERISLLELGI